MTQQSSTRRGAPASAYLLGALAPLSWGTVFIVTTSYLPSDSPLWIAALRALPAGLAMALAGRRLLRGAWWWRSAILGILNIGLTFAGIFVAASRLPGGVASTIGSLQPLILMPFAWLHLRRRPAPAAWPAVIVGTIGVALMVLGPAARLDLVGVLAMLGATASLSWGMVLNERWGKPMPLVPFTGWQLIFGGLFVAALALPLEGRPPSLDGAGLLAACWIGFVATGLAYALWFGAAEKLSSQTVAILSRLNPATAVVVGAVVAGELLTAVQLVGLLLVLGSVVLGRLRLPARPAVAIARLALRR